MWTFRFPILETRSYVRDTPPVVIQITEDVTVTDDPAATVADADGGGIPDFLDPDTDNDGVPDADEGTEDRDGDGKPDYKDADPSTGVGQTPDLLPGQPILPGASTSFLGSGFAPGSPVTMFFQSDPVEIGTTTADESGSIDIVVTIPANAGNGPHQLVAIGHGLDGGPHTVTANVFVYEAPCTNHRH